MNKLRFPSGNDVGRTGPSVVPRGPRNLRGASGLQSHRPCRGDLRAVLALAHVSPERASGRPAMGNALDRDGHEKVVFRANGPTTRRRRPVGPLGRENHPLAFRLPGRCPSMGDGLGLRPARPLQFHAKQNLSARSSIQGPLLREFCAGHITSIAMHPRTGRTLAGPFGAENACWPRSQGAAPGLSKRAPSGQRDLPAAADAARRGPCHAARQKDLPAADHNHDHDHEYMVPDMVPGHLGGWLN